MKRFLEFIDEVLKKKYCVRDGKRVFHWKTNKPEKYRVEYDETGKPREVRMTTAEQLHRKNGQRKAKAKRKGKQNLIDTKRKKSFNIRKRTGLGSYNKQFPDVNAARERNA